MFYKNIKADSTDLSLVDHKIHELGEQYTNLKNEIDIYDEENRKVHDQLKKEHDDLKDVVNSNYALAQSIFTQNDIVFKKLEKRLDKSLKFIIICIILVLFLLIITGYIIFAMHFKIN